MNERGFSLVELMVAIMILTVGILGLAATAGGVQRMVGWGARFSGSAAVANAKLEQLRGTPCSSLAASGTATQGIYDLSWTVASSGNLRTFSLSVSYPNGRSTRVETFETQRSCV